MLKITLKSDLCAASGDSFSSVIDTDVSYDKYGFPFIGGRRLKGCLREAAELIVTDKDLINKIFGESGNSSSGSLKLSDAHIEDYDSMIKEAEGINAEKITSLYTYTRAATAIKNDTAKDNSLRFTRVVRHYSPIDNNSELVFIARCELDPEYDEEFACIAKALRNIGYKRNRGFGAVKCEYIPEHSNAAVSDCFDADTDDVRIKYTVRLTDNVMIPGAVSDETADYIPGTSVLGFFANAYLKNNTADSEFEELFLKNNIRFSNLYISDENGREYFPAPVILGKIKGEKGAVNIVTRPRDEKIVKPVKSGYTDFSANIIKPLTETVYHHSKKVEKTKAENTKVEKTKDPTEKEDKTTLYTQTAICSGQFFSGTITGKSSYVKKIYEILTGSMLHFGRSKTAQYSSCELVKAEVLPVTVDTIKISAGQRFMALLLSDAIIPDGFGGYDISAYGLKNAIGHGVEKLDIYSENEINYSAMRYRIIAGYNSKWNMQKPQFRTPAAGSTLVFTAKEDMELPVQLTIGAKTGEGFGSVMICRPEKFVPAVPEKENRVAADGILSKLIRKNEMIEEMRNEAVSFAASYWKSVNSSQLGRYTMMVKNANDFSDLKNHMVEKIKSKKSKADFDSIIKNSEAEKYKELWRDYLVLILTLMKYENRGGEKK